MAGDSNEEEMRDETVPKLKLMGVAQNWIFEYCMYHLWQQFIRGEALSEEYQKALIDILHSKIGQDPDDMSGRFNCIRLISTLCKVRDNDTGQDVQHLKQSMNIFDIILEVFPFSTLEKTHMRSVLKLQTLLASYRSDTKRNSKKLFRKLYIEEEQEFEEYKEEIKNLFASQDVQANESFLGKHTFENFLEDLSKFLAPFWNQFPLPLLEEKKELFQDMDEDKIDDRILKEIHLAVDESEDTEKSWEAIVKGTHPDIVAFKQANKPQQPKRSECRELRTKNGLLPADYTKPGSSKDSIQDHIERCKEARMQLEKSSKRLLSSMSSSSPSSDDDDETVNTSMLSSSSHSPQAMMSKVVRRRGWMKPQPTSEELEWDSSDEDVDTRHKVIKLPPRKRVLRIDLIKPIVRKRRKWNEEETNWLADGVEKFGAGNWATILKGYPFKGRTAVNLKDRWRNMQH